MQKKWKFYDLLIPLLLLGSTTLSAAVLDNLFSSIHLTETHQKHHRRRHGRDRHHTVSDEKKWQISLKFLGYYHGKIDGDLLTTESYSAIKDFQQRNQYFAAGTLEDDSKRYLSEIYEAIRLKNYIDYDGDNSRKKGRKIQAALAAEGIYHGKIDGKLGKRSKESILLYKESLERNGTKEARLSAEEESRLTAEAATVLEERLKKYREEASFSSKKSADAPEAENGPDSIDRSSMADILGDEEENRSREAPL